MLDNSSSKIGYIIDLIHLPKHQWRNEAEHHPNHQAVWKSLEIMGTLEKCGNWQHPITSRLHVHLPVRNTQTWKIVQRNEVLLKHPKIFYSLSSHRSMVFWRFVWEDSSSSKAAALSLVQQRELLGSLGMHFDVLHWWKKREREIEERIERCCVLSREEALHFKG